MTSARTYIAGTGASGALIGAALVSFTLLTALVAFDGFPAGGGAGATDSVTLTRASVDAPEVVAAPAAAALAAAPAAVAPAPVLVAAAPPVDSGTGETPAPPVTPDGTPVPPGPGAPPVVTPVGNVPIPGGEPAPDRGNPVQSVVGGLDQTLSDVTGLDSSLNSVTEPVTDIVDQTLENLTGRDLGETVDGLGVTLNGQPLVGEQGTGLAGTGLLPGVIP